MKSYVKSLLFSVAVMSNQTYATQPDTHSFQAPLAPESLLLDIASYKQDYLLAVGERGHILLSRDGLNWSQQQVPSTATLTAVDTQGKEVWAVGHDATIVHSSDSGQSWQVQQSFPELEKPLLDVLFFDQHQGIAIGAYGLFYRTLDGGENWLKEDHPEFLSPDDQDYLLELKQEDEGLYQQELASILPHLNRVNRVGNKLYLAGEMGLLAMSQDLGKSWQRMDINYYGSFFDVNQDFTGRIVAAGLRGNVFTLDPENNRWKKVAKTGQSSFNSIVNQGSTSTLVVGNNGRILTLSSDADTLEQTPEGKAILNGVWFNNALIAVTEQGIVTLNGE